MVKGACVRTAADIQDPTLGGYDWQGGHSLQVLCMKSYPRQVALRRFRRAPREPESLTLLRPAAARRIGRALIRLADAAEGRE